MNKNQIKTGSQIMLAQLLKKKRPIIVGWAISGRCNLACGYCRWGKEKLEEIDTDTALALVDQMKKAGARHVVFSGGEPLLREDLGQIARACKDADMMVALDSNGILVPQRPWIFQHVDRLQLSLDGPEKQHDGQRGKGAFDALLSAIKTAKEHDVALSFNTTLTNANINYIGWIVEFATQQGASVDFQPVSPVHADCNQIRCLLPSPNGYAKAMFEIERLKKSGAPVTNSQACLNHLKKYPTPTKIKCTAGRIITRIDPAGRLFPCNQMRLARQWPSAVEMGFEKAFQSMPEVGCNECWCSATVELNLLGGFNLDAIINQAKIL